MLSLAFEILAHPLASAVCFGAGVALGHLAQGSISSDLAKAKALAAPLLSKAQSAVSAIKAKVLKK